MQAGFFGRKKVPTDAPPPGTAPQTSPGTGPADDDTLLAPKATPVNDDLELTLDGELVAETASDSGLSSCMDTSQSNRA